MGSGLESRSVITLHLPLSSIAPCFAMGWLSHSLASCQSGKDTCRFTDCRKRTCGMSTWHKNTPSTASNSSRSRRAKISTSSLNRGGIAAPGKERRSGYTLVHFISFYWLLGPKVCNPAPSLNNSYTLFKLGRQKFSSQEKNISALK